MIEEEKGLETEDETGTETEDEAGTETEDETGTEDETQSDTGIEIEIAIGTEIGTKTKTCAEETRVKPIVAAAEKKPTTKGSCFCFE